ncbi:MAG: hypothetical protein GF417_12480 [Candidatus Latescibacteria bacterium]|nr:hypothetical protein [bacterium]MBD3425245.1 hypothetical protein [Candidatus Latescibacterota bacterium]
MGNSMLLSGYRKEKDNYLRILSLAEKQREMLIEGRMDEVIAILRNKKKIMNDIESIERSMERDKKNYRSGYRKYGDAAELIREISGIVEKILSVERENEIIFSTGCRAGASTEETATAVPAPLVAASYGGKMQGGKI